MEKPLWSFIDNYGTFLSRTANRFNTLYFPLCNTTPFMSAITPDLHGDNKTGNNSFLLQPVSRIDLKNSRSSRNFWIYVNPRKVWSACGVSKDLAAIKNDQFTLEAGLLWQKISRGNLRIGLKSEVTSFVPATPEPVEIMRVTITNISSRPVRFIPTAAIPLYGRSCDNLRDHRHVTSLLSRVQTHRSGVILTPTLSFDETGHKQNHTSYFVFGIDGSAKNPQYIHAAQDEFCGDGGDLEAPRAVLKNLPPPKNYCPQGKEPMAGLRFAAVNLAPGKSLSYIIVMGIVNNRPLINRIFAKFNSGKKVAVALQATKDHWKKISAQISLNTQDDQLDNWFRWVTVQPVLRKIFGCSFLPDFDYGRGGRGWRDLWQDCLSLILTSPEEVRPLLVNNFSGVRIDGSNATIIGQKPGEFIADRNNLSRVWMDHGVWPLITTLLYIHQTGDLKILLEQSPYFRDRQLRRGREIDRDWTPGNGIDLTTAQGKIYKGTVLEHLLIQNLVQFFNVGTHNHIRLEGADWNDGLDMAGQNGESVAFTCMYAHNLLELCEILEKLNTKNFVILKELGILLDSLSRHPLNYARVSEKTKLLEKYFRAVEPRVSGETISIPAKRLIRDLKNKEQWIRRHIQKTEWLKEGFFNGYYNNDGKKVEGKINGRIRMTLTGQVFPVMSGIATDAQVKTLFNQIKIYLKDRQLGGFRLNTDFKEQQLNLGRAFSFVYGDKENGAFFNHMSVMFAYALYARGFTQEGFEVLSAICRMSLDTAVSKIYPCLPEYFNAEGRGMYSYLTGSASWLILSILTRVFGIRGEYGDLLIEPKLTAGQFKTNTAISLTASFAGRRIEVRFKNARKKDAGKYRIAKVALNDQTIDANLNQPRFLISRRQFLCLAVKPLNIIEVTLD